MIRAMWVKSNLPLSRLIMWAFNEPCSHFSISFDDDYVIHSDLLGTESPIYSWFMKQHIVVHQIAFNVSTGVQAEVLNELHKKFPLPRSYDFGAFLYFAWRAVLFKFLGLPLPKKNIWNKKNRYMCEEIAVILKPIFGFVIPEDLDITTPEKLWLVQRRSPS